jgi:hypothetical protein
MASDPSSCLDHEEAFPSLTTDSLVADLEQSACSIFVSCGAAIQ